MTIAFLFVGPAPFLPFVPSVRLIQMTTTLSGIGIGAMIVSTFQRVLRTAKQYGFQDNMTTNLVISGLWTASFHLGNFAGPTLAGFLVDNWHFRGASFVYCCSYVLMAAIDGYCAFKSSRFCRGCGLTSAGLGRGLES